jgi:hypothetical protein
MYYSMPINMFFIVKNYWEPSFTDNPRTFGRKLMKIPHLIALAAVAISYAL